MPTSVEVLRASVEAHNDTFEALLNLIPAKYYLPKDDHDGDDNVRYLNFQSFIDESTRRTDSVQVSKTQQKQEGAQTSCEGGIKKGSQG
jgi:hypothetical protein